jgi:alpha-tubulin suppressor-like RCC1 family protein
VAGANILTPQPVAGGFSDWVSIKPGWPHLCGVRANGSLYCWGKNTNGQFGNGTAPSTIVQPVTLIAGVTVKVN